MNDVSIPWYTTIGGRLEPNLLENWGHCSCGWTSQRMIGPTGPSYVWWEGLQHQSDQIPEYPHTVWVESKWSYVDETNHQST